MSLPSRDQEREPVEVRVSGADGGGATVGGVPVVAAGEEPQQAVLKHLRRMARATGSPVLARVHDERVGYVVPLQVDPDGASRFTAEPTAIPVTVPLGEFGPPPVMGAGPRPAEGSVPESGPYATGGHRPYPNPAPAPAHEPPHLHTPVPAHEPPHPHTPAPAPPRTHTHTTPARPAPAEAADLRPTPPRGFDAVAEAVLGEGEDGAPPAPAPTATTQISDAVKSGRIDAAATLAERALVEASRALGPEHPDVLRLTELAAYVAYLAGDPERAFRLSLELAAIHHHRTRDAEAAYSNVQSAATAWRAVRDPELGMALGRELLGLWTQLADGEGVAAEDAEELEAARARMLRLAERARRAEGAASRP
ncbi:tetratricopeptide repeat protein [Streptomyces broussonetiae]|uniref:Tetratricopeptide repeat protein n=1 Tax=Streptomyces broussonetiae TaxID=2686304 RepID=A0ABV5E9Z9_9ACTN